MIRRYWLFLVAGLARAQQRIPNPVEAHQHADTIDIPRFVAAFNEWRMGHPEGVGHEHKLDVGDLKRWKAVRTAWHDTDSKMKEAGYL